MKKLLATLTFIIIAVLPLISFAATNDGNFAVSKTDGITIPDRITYLDERNGWISSCENLLENFYSCTSPETVYVADYDYEGGYPYRMFFYGWAYTQGNEPAGRYEGYPGGDAIFCARAESIYGPWQVWSEKPETGENFWDENMIPYFWCPVLTCETDCWYDSWHIADATVVYADGLFHMLCSSQGTDVDGLFGDFAQGDTDGYSGCTIGAVSNDGLHWTKASEPLLIWENEKGFNENAVGGWYTGKGYYGALGQPSLLYEDGIWKCWFTYNCSVRSAMWGYAENRGDFLNANDWVFVKYLEDPITSIKGTTDFDVIKVGDIYYAFANTWLNYYGIDYDYLQNYPLSDWKNMASVCITQYMSYDGLEWSPVGYFYPDDDASGCTCPQVMYDPKTQNICVFYGVQRGKVQGVSYYDWRWYAIRVRTCNIEDFCKNYAYYDKPAPKENWNDIYYNHQVSGNGKFDADGLLLPFESDEVKIYRASGFDLWHGNNKIIENGSSLFDDIRLLGVTPPESAEISDGKLRITSALGKDYKGTTRFSLCIGDAQTQSAVSQAKRADGIGIYVENNTDTALSLSSFCGCNDNLYAVNKDDSTGYFITLDGLCSQYAINSASGIVIPAGAKGYAIVFNRDLKVFTDYIPEESPILNPGVRIYGAKVNPQKNESIVFDDFFYFGISNTDNRKQIGITSSLHTVAVNITATPTETTTAAPDITVAPENVNVTLNIILYVAITVAVSAAIVTLVIIKKRK